MFRSSHTDRYGQCNPKKLAAYPDLCPSGGSHKSTANHQLPDDFSDLTPCQNLFRRDGKSGTNPWVFVWFPKIHGENPWCFLGFSPVLFAFSPMHFAPPGACLPTRSLFPISTSSSTSTELIAASCHTKCEKIPLNFRKIDWTQFFQFVAQNVLLKSCCSGV